MTHRTKWRLVCALLAIAVIATLPYTVTFRRGLLDVLPFLVLLACPLIHLVRHRHGAGHDGRTHAPSPAPTSAPAREALA